MTTRLTSRTVLFCHPFILSGFERVEPAGSYHVQTEEEEIDGATVAVSAWRRINTVMHIHRTGVTECVTIDPLELEKALTRDAGPEEAPAVLTARLDADRARNNARLMRRRKL